MKEDGTRFDYHGVYDDVFVRTKDGWRIKARKQYSFFTMGKKAEPKKWDPAIPLQKGASRALRTAPRAHRGSSVLPVRTYGGPRFHSSTNTFPGDRLVIFSVRFNDSNITYLSTSKTSTPKYIWIVNIRIFNFSFSLYKTFFKLDFELRVCVKVKLCHDVLSDNDFDVEHTYLKPQNSGGLCGGILRFTFKFY